MAPKAAEIAESARENHPLTAWLQQQRLGPLDRTTRESCAGRRARLIKEATFGPQHPTTAKTTNIGFF